MRNIIKTMLLATTLLFALGFTQKSQAQTVEVWENMHNRSIYFQAGIDEYQSNQYCYKPNKNGTDALYYDVFYHWINGVLQPGFPLETDSSFSFAFENYSYAYYDWNWSSIQSVNTTVKVWNKTSSSKLIKFNITARLISSIGVDLGPFVSQTSRVVSPGATWIGDPFVGTNYKSGTLTVVVATDDEW
jgi:hypothetical protein